MTERPAPGFEAVLFDLDGTLIDTAPDMVAVLLGMQSDHGKAPLPYELVRSHVSNGSLGLVRLAFPEADEDRSRALQQDYLDRYEQAVCVDSVLFPGMEDLLDRIENAGRPWGIVTNKPARMTEPLLKALELDTRTACSISGDTLPQRKPDPAPLLHASRQIGVPAERMVYVGDAARDIEAGRAAGMYTIAASYGYVPAEDDPDSWQADFVAGDVTELAHFLSKDGTLSD